MIKLELNHNLEKRRALFETLEAETVKTRIKQALAQGLDLAAQNARANVSGGVVNTRSGALKRSITVGRINEHGREFSGWVGNSPPLGPGAFNYGAALEFGFRIGPLAPKKKKALRFVDRSGNVVFAKLVKGRLEPPRPWLENAVMSAAPHIDRLLAGALKGEDV